MSEEKEKADNEEYRGRHDIFISYSSKNKNVADAIVAEFEQHGIRCWYAPRDIMPGQEWVSAIRDGLGTAKVFILIYTDESNRSRQVMNEVAMAFKGGKTIVPFRLTEDDMNSELEYYLTRVHWLDAVSKPLSENISQLREYIAKILQGEPVGGSGAQNTLEKMAPAGKVRIVDKGKQKKILIFAAIAAVILLLLGGIAFSSWRKQNAEKLLAQGIELLYSPYHGAEANAQAEEIFTKTAEMGAADSWYYLGKISERDYDYEMALSLYEIGRERGSALCFVGLGDLYFEGKGVLRDVYHAKGLYEQALSMGCGVANLGIGRLILAGEAEFDADTEQAVSCFLEYMNNSPEGEFAELKADFMLLLGRYYQYGLMGTQPDPEKALAFYERALAESPCYEGLANRSMARHYLAEGEDVAAEDHYRQAFAYFQAAADAGSAEDMVSLARAYRYGEGVGVDAAAALTWYEKAWEAGNPYGAIGAAELYRDGTGAAQDAGKAYEWYCRGADAGDLSAMLAIGDLYAEGSYGADAAGVPDYRMAEQWYEKALDAGSAEAYQRMGLLYAAGQGEGANGVQDHETALVFYREGADLGSAEARIVLGEAYAAGYGENGAADEYKAAECYKTAAMMGNAGGMYRLAELCEEAGETEQAAGWYLRAANAEIPEAEAMLRLGQMYESGELEAPDAAQALRWYGRAAEAGRTEAMYYLGRMYLNGISCAPDVEAAAVWFRQGAEAGEISCMCALARLYDENLIAGENNWQDAIQWYTRAAEAGDADAAKELGWMYYADGYIETSCDWWKQAADAGNDEAFVYLGRAYYRGEGVARDEGQAFQYFQQAAEDGYAFGKYLLALCYENGIGTEADPAEASRWLADAQDDPYDAEGMMTAEIRRFMQWEHDSVLDVLNWLEN